MNIKKNHSIPEDYINIVYGDKPFTTYPSVFTKYLVEKYKIKEGAILLDFGCGRGEFLIAACPNAKIKQADIENDGLPYPDNYFDVVFSKSVIEHFHNPDIFTKEIHRCLKPGGLAIILVPSWEYNYKIYFEDYTHRTPFMMSALNDILLIHGFNEVEVSFFKQLPILWGNLYWILNPLSFITRLVTPRLLGKYFKWVRFSKEIMLLSTSRKPTKCIT